MQAVSDTYCFPKLGRWSSCCATLLLGGPLSWTEHNGGSRNLTRCSPGDNRAGLDMRDIREGETRIGSGGLIHTSRKSLVGGPVCSGEISFFRGSVAQDFFRSRLLREQIELSANIKFGLEKEKQLEKVGTVLQPRARREVSSSAGCLSKFNSL